MVSSEIQQLEGVIGMQIDTTTTDTAVEPISMTATTTATTTVVNRIPSTASSRKKNKRRHSFSSKQSGSNDSSTAGDGSLVLQQQQKRGRGGRQQGSPKRYKAMEVDEEVFEKLDPSQPEHARRIFQRHKAISKGKNTVGYQQYVRHVPKHERHPRSMKTPSTPDPSLDIPAKRWQGLVKAWRIALHDYDPPELVRTATPGATNVDVSASDDSMTPSGYSKSESTTSDAFKDGTTSRASELEKAAAMGVLVDLDDRLNSPGGSTSSPRSNPGSPISVLSHSSPRRLRLQDLEDDTERPLIMRTDSIDNRHDLALEEVDSDSDDDLL